MIRMRERGIAAVVLGRAVRVEHLQRAPARGDPAVQLFGGRRRDRVHHVRPVLGVLPEPLVELAAEPTGDVRDDAVERFPALLVDVEIVVDERAEQPAGLRAPVGVRVAESAWHRVALLRGPVLEPRDRVTEGRDAEPYYRGAHGGVDHLIEAALLEPAVEPDVPRIWKDPAGVDPGGAPTLPRARQ